MEPTGRREALPDDRLREMRGAIVAKRWPRISLRYIRATKLEMREHRHSGMVRKDQTYDVQLHIVNLEIPGPRQSGASRNDDYLTSMPVPSPDTRARRPAAR
jgi:hypothetical protein